MGKPTRRTELGTFVQLYYSYKCISIHNGLECIKAKMKLSVLQDGSHSEKEKEDRLEQIDIDIHHTEEIMKHDLEYRGMCNILNLLSYLYG